MNSSCVSLLISSSIASKSASISFIKKKVYNLAALSPYFFLNYFYSRTDVLNVEELATLWHFPGQILKVPTLERIESKEAAPPTNLPI